MENDASNSNTVKEACKKNEIVGTELKKAESASESKEKHLSGFFISLRTRTIPKKTITTTEKDKNEPSRFLGEGVTFKAKLIGILEVEEATGDKMCQEALFELKTAVRAAGEHKQRINIAIAVDGIRLRDEKTGDCLHHHPVHKISFIAQDVADSRAFGYIFGSPDTSHRFFGIKTDKAASQVVMAMKDLFQAVYELKKREIEMAKQNIEQHQLKYGSSFFLDSMTASSSKISDVDQIIRKPISKEETINKSVKNKTQTASVIADLMDLELELSSLQQGLSQMERLTPSDLFGRAVSQPKEDPFGDSFTPPPCIITPPSAKLRPPPTADDRHKIGSSSSAHSQSELHWFDKETQGLFSNEKNSAVNEANKKEDSSCSEKLEPMSRDLYDIFMELDPLAACRSKPYTDKKDFFQELKNTAKNQLIELKSEICSFSTGDAPVSTSSPEAIPSNSLFADNDHLRKYNSGDSSNQYITLSEGLAKSSNISYDRNSDLFETSFANFASFGGEHTSSQVTSDRSSVPRRSPLSHTCQPSPNSQIKNMASSQALKSSSNSSCSVYRSVVSGDDIDSASTYEPFLRHSSPQWSGLPEGELSKQKIVINLRKVLSNADDTDKENDSPVDEETIVLKKSDTIATPYNRREEISSDSFESIPEPPPRPITSPVSTQPPPLPPKKLHLPVTLKLPQRTSSDTSFRYDYIENDESFGSKNHRHGNAQIPPLPAPARKPKFNENVDRDYARRRPHKQQQTNVSSSESEYYLTPISKKQESSSKPQLNITISQLTSTGFDDLATILKIPAFKISNMTLKELTVCLSKLSDADCQKLEKNMNSKNSNKSVDNDSRLSYQSLNESFEEDLPKFKVNFEDKFPSRATTISLAPPCDKYAVFRELIDQKGKISLSPSVQEDTKQMDSDAKIQSVDEGDRYAALRAIPFDVDKNEERKKSKDDKIVLSNHDYEMEDEKQSEENNIKAPADTVKTDISTQPLNSETETDGEDERRKKYEVTSSEKAAVVGKNWAKFEEQEEMKSPSWQDMQKQTFEYKKQRLRRCWEDYDVEDDFEDDVDDEENELDDDVNNEDSEENCSSKKSAASSLDESSWRENGWSDRDSLYDEDIETYNDHYQFNKKEYHRKYSPRKMIEHLPWEEEINWSTSGHRGRHEQRYNICKTRTPPRLSAKSERKRFNKRETDELAFLKMMLGKKRLKALEEQIFKQYQEQLEKAPIKKYSTKGNLKQYKGSSSSSSLLVDRRFEVAEGFKRYGRNYTAQRPKSADKGNKPLLVPETEEPILSKKYSKPYSFDELSFSDDDRWAAVSNRSSNFKKFSRNRNHSRNSPFKNNFTPTQVYEFSADDGELTPPAVKSPTSSITPPLKSRSQAKFLTMTRASEMKKQTEFHPEYSHTRRSRESSQRQSPFEDDFSAPVEAMTQKSEKERDSLDDEVFYSNTKSATRRHRYEAKRTISEGANKKHYENVELWKKTSPSSVENHITQSKERYGKNNNVDLLAAGIESPKKGRIRQHDPFNDNLNYELRTIPRLSQKSKSKSKRKDFNSGSDSNPENTIATTAVKSREDANSFSSFSKQQQQQHTNSK